MTGLQGDGVAKAGKKKPKAKGDAEKSVDEESGGGPVDEDDASGGDLMVAEAAAGGGDILANLEARLKPVEKYAVRLLYP